MILEERIQTDLVTAMKAGEAVRRDTLRLAKTALKNESIAQSKTLTDAEAETVLTRLVKQLNQAAIEYTQLGDTQRAAAENEQAELLKPYLPTPLTNDEITALVDQAITATNANSPKDMGQVMAALKPLVGNRADGASLAALVKAKLVPTNVD